MPGDSQESYRALVTLLQVALDLRPEWQLERLLRGLDPESLRARASQEGVSGLLSEYTLRWQIPIDLSEVNLQVADKRAYRLELFRLQEGLKKAGTSLLLLKGAALSGTIYGRRPTRWRPWRDLDLLVEPGQMTTVQRILADMGYRSDPSGYLRERLCIDLHSDLLGASRIPTRSKVFCFDTDAIWGESLPLHGGLPNLRILSPHHQFSHLSVHAMKHSYSRLVWLLDLALLYPTLEPERMWRTARRCRSARAVAMALQLLNCTLGVELDPLSRHRLPAFHWPERLFFAWMKEGRQPLVMGELLCVLQAPTLASGAAYLKELCFPPGGAPPVQRLVKLAEIAWGEVRRLLGLV